MISVFIQALLQLIERITTLATQLKIVSTVKAALIGASGTVHLYHVITNIYLIIRKYYTRMIYL